MKTPKVLALLFSAAALLGGLAPCAEAKVSFSFFYESLSPHGEWIEVGDYGNCWRPTGVGSDWSPYTDGYWTYTDAGWTWVSYEDFGGITYHYGRWVQVEDEGWCWTPGYEWGPAWVSWRHSDNHVGWAPLPPEARFRREVGLSVWVDTSYDIAPSYYNFCETRHFGAPLLRPVIIDRSQNVTIIENTVNITNITYNNYSNVVYNGGPNYAAINRRSERPIPSLKLVQNTNVNVTNNFNDGERQGGRRERRGLPRAMQRGNQLEVFAPEVVQNDQDADAIRPKRRVAGEKVRRGLGEVKDEGVRNRLRNKLRQESNGLTAESAPARPVQASDLEVVPQKADPNAPSQARTGKGRRNQHDRQDAATGDNTAERGKPNRNRKPSDIIAAPEPVTPSTEGQTAATPGEGNAAREEKLGRRERRESAVETLDNADRQDKVARQTVKQRGEAAEAAPGNRANRRQDRNAEEAGRAGESQAEQRAERLRQRQAAEAARQQGTADQAEESQSGRADKLRQRQAAEAARQQAAADQTRREMNADRAATEARRQQQQAARAAEENTSRQSERAEQRREEQQQQRAAANRAAGEERAAQMARQRAAQQAEGQAAERRQQQMQQQRSQAQQERAFEAQRQRATESRQQRSQEMQQQRALQMQQQQRASQMQQQRAAQMQQRPAQAQQQRAAQMQQQQQFRRQQAAPQGNGGGGGGGGGKRKKDRNEE